MIRVLIVDDREESRYFLATLLKSSGYEVESACHGAEALDKARRNPPQLIISDLLMPVMDGYTLLRQWKADDRLKPIPFIVYTATYTDPKDKQLGLSLGTDAFILKPAEPADLIAQIRQVLARPTAEGMAVSPARASAVPASQPIAVPEEEEARNLRQYSEVLIHKLEDKMEELDRANRELQRDIAERKRMEEAHARLATAVEQAAEAIVITDATGTIVYVNPAFEKTTGYTRQEAVGQNPRLLKSGKHDDAFYRQMWDAITQGKVWSGRIINRKKNGALYEEEMTVSPIRNSAGRIINYVAVQRDITQEVELEMQLRQAQKMEAIGQLAGGVAHDFNNILTVIHGNASLLLNPELNPAKRAGYTEQILRASERAAGLTRQLLMFSRKQIVQPASLNLNQVVEGMVKMLKRILGEDIAMHSDLTSALPPILADVGMIEQVLLNLAVNARDAMPGGGRLTIASGIRTLDEEQAQQHPNTAPGEYVWFSVSDTGCGIAPENLTRIFEPFYTTKPAGQGTGLGLATVYGIVEQHHGWIDVTSEVGKGATFQVYLPAAKGAWVEPKPDATTAPLPAGNETILVVEDDLSLCVLISRVLESCGHTVLRAANAAAAIQVWKNNRKRIALLLTDLVLPDGISGFELARKFQAEEPQLKTIFASGYPAKRGEGPPLIEGVNFLQKPYSSENLAQTVRSCLDQREECKNSQTAARAN